MCGGSGWGQEASAASTAPGTDMLAPAGNCDYVQEFSGPMSMFFRPKFAILATLNYPTCAEAGVEVQQSGDYLLTAPDGSTFLSYCLLARDAGVEGGPPFTRFWYYDRRTGGWPDGEDDVLGAAYGTCSPDNTDYCFGRMPADVTAADTQN